MERIRHIFIFIAVFLCFSNMPAKADDTMSLSTLITPQNVSVEMCNKTFNMPPEKLLYLAIASANANRFNIEEIQTKTGYILFTAVNKQYLASVIKLDDSRAILKITPTNNVYYFAPGIVLNFFKYIDMNSAAQITSIPQKS